MIVQILKCSFIIHNITVNLKQLINMASFTFHWNKFQWNWPLPTPIPPLNSHSWKNFSVARKNALSDFFLSIFRDLCHLLNWVNWVNWVILWKSSNFKSSATFPWAEGWRSRVGGHFVSIFSWALWSDTGNLKISLEFCLGYRWKICTSSQSNWIRSV